MSDKPDRIEQQIQFFGYPLARLAQERQLSVRLTFPGNMKWITLLNRWHQRYARELRSAGRQSR